MSDRALSWLFKSFLLVLVLGLGGGGWYYTIGRKPKLLFSTPAKVQDGETSVRATAPGEFLLLTGPKATLYDLARKQARWSVDLSAPRPPAAPFAAAGAKAPAAPSAPLPPAASPPEEPPDPLLAQRVKRDFARLEKWSAELNKKRGSLKSALQIEAFNTEAAKYHQELVAAQAEAAPLHQKGTTKARVPAAPAPEEGDQAAAWRPAGERLRTEVVAFESGLWIARGNRLTGFDPKDGHVLKDFALPGRFSQFLAGPQHLYVLTASPTGRETQILRVAAADGSASTVAAVCAPEPAGAGRLRAGERPRPPETRTIFSAQRSSLLQCDLRLVEAKITERQAVSGDSISDMEEADRKTTGGWGADAAVYSQALAKDALREATGNKLYTDESTYEAVLRRPFDAALAPGRVTVHGRAQIFSTPSLDLVAAGRELLAFDHHNQKRWQAALAQPVTLAGETESAEPGAATPASPVLEAGDLLYFFDAAFLTAFQRDTGQPAWRLPAAGIRKVQLDPSGGLYLASAGPDGLPLLQKIDARTGKIAWKAPKYDDCFVSGKDLYVSRETRNAGDAVDAVFDRSKAIQCRWKLYKLSTRSGEAQWEWFQTRRPLQIAADRKNVALLFADELQVITSIAL